jgi:hypothetical protein
MRKWILLTLILLLQLPSYAARTMTSLMVPSCAKTCGSTAPCFATIGPTARWLPYWHITADRERFLIVLCLRNLKQATETFLLNIYRSVTIKVNYTKAYVVDDT